MSTSSKSLKHSSSAVIMKIMRTIQDARSLPVNGRSGSTPAELAAPSQLAVKLENLLDPSTYLNEFGFSADEEIVSSVDKILGSLSQSTKDLALFERCAHQQQNKGEKKWTRMGDKRFLSKGHELRMSEQEPQMKKNASSSNSSHLAETHSARSIKTESGLGDLESPFSLELLSREPLSERSILTESAALGGNSRAISFQQQVSLEHTSSEVDLSTDVLEGATAVERRMYRSSVLASRRANRAASRPSMSRLSPDRRSVKPESKADLKQRRNREAAQKSRQDRIDKMKNLEQRNADLEKQVDDLRREISLLRGDSGPF